MVRSVPKSSRENKRHDHRPERNRPPAATRPRALSRAVIVEEARHLGLPDYKARALLKDALECDYLFIWPDAGEKGRVMIANVRPPPPAERTKAKRGKGVVKNPRRSQGN